MDTVGGHEFGGVDVYGSAASRRQRFSEKCRRHPFAARHEQVHRTRFEMSEHRDRTTQIAILARGVVDAGQERASFSARR
jgi:hypothetical protein